MLETNPANWEPISQLVNWIIVGKYTYWAKGISFPSTIIIKIIVWVACYKLHSMGSHTNGVLGGFG